MGLEETTKKTIVGITNKWLDRDNGFETDAAIIFLRESLESVHLYLLLSAYVKHTVIDFLKTTLERSEPDVLKTSIDRQWLNTQLVQPLVDNRYELVTPQNTYDIFYLSIFCDMIWESINNNFQEEVISVLGKLD